MKWAIYTRVSVGRRHWSAAVELVPCHVAKVQARAKEKEVYGIFIAPQIDVNTAITFFGKRLVPDLKF